MIADNRILLTPSLQSRSLIFDGYGVVGGSQRRATSFPISAGSFKDLNYAVFVDDVQYKSADKVEDVAEMAWSLMDSVELNQSKWKLSILGSEILVQIMSAYRSAILCPMR